MSCCVASGGVGVSRREDRVSGGRTRTAALAHAKICIVTSELAGLDGTGGIGSYCLALAEALADQATVTEILYTRSSDGRPYVTRGDFRDHQRRFARRGIRLSALDATDAENHWRAQSYQVMQHLAEGEYSLVIFNDINGAGFYPVLSRRTGNPRFKDTIMCVVAHGATQWMTQLNETPVRSFGGMVVLEMERQATELADVLLAPSNFILEQYRSYGWKLPARTLVLPNLVLLSGKSSAPPVEGAVGRDLCFFGRLETRKGLWMFCAALDRLRPRLKDRRVVFLGKPVIENGQSTEIALLHRAAAWPCEISIITDLDSEPALAYLKRHGLVAVMPSIEDNSPSVILECLSRRIPFIASAAGGGIELVSEASRERNFVAPSVSALTDALAQALEQGGQCAAPAFDETRARQNYLEAIATLLPLGYASSTRRVSAKVSIVMLAMLPSEYSSEAVSGAIRRLFREYGDDLEIVLLSERPDVVSACLEAEASHRVTVVPMKDLGALFSELSKRKQTLVGLTHISQFIPSVWFERAEACFSGIADAAAVTGMVRSPSIEFEGGGEPEGKERPDRYLLGNSPAFLSMSQLTNRGFAIFHADALEFLGAVTPIDAQYGRLLRMEDWVHMLLCTLSLAGRVVALVPDLLVSEPVRERPSEIFRLGPFSRFLIKTQMGHAAGSEAALLSRLAIETASRILRERAHAQCLEEVAAQLKGSLPAGEGIGTGSLRELTRLAYLAGHVDAARELLANAAFEPGAAEKGLSSLIHLGATSIRLFDLASAETNVQRIHLDNAWSYKLIGHLREIEIHPNLAREGRATLGFFPIDLQEQETFSCGIALPDRSAKSVRFRVDLMTLDGESQYAAEQVLSPGKSLRWRFELPKELRKKARVMLSVESADPTRDPTHSYTRWHEPQFQRASEEGR